MTRPYIFLQITSEPKNNGGCQMPRKPLTSLTIDTHVRCQQFFPKRKRLRIKS